MAREEKESPKIREAIGIFFEADKVRETIDDLSSSGFDRAAVGLLAGERTVRQSLGDLYSETITVEGDEGAPNMAFVAKESIGDTARALEGDLFFVGMTIAGAAAVASAGVLGGGLLVAATGAAAVTAVGAVMGRLIHQSDAEYLEEQIDEGHLLLFVRTRDPDEEERAVEILSRHAAYDARIHAVPPLSQGAG